MLKNPKKADLDKDGKLSGYEKKRGMAIEKAMSGKKFGGAMKNKPIKAVLGAIALGAAGALGAKKLLKKKKATANPGKGPIRKGIMGNLVDEKKKELMVGSIKFEADNLDFIEMPRSSNTKIKCKKLNELS